MGKHVITLYISLKLLEFIHMEDHRLEKRNSMGRAPPYRDNLIGSNSGWDGLKLAR